MPNYPPEPWRMAGDGFLSAWWIPAADVPDAPAGYEPISVAGHALVLTAWVNYHAPSPLTYHELLAAVAVRGGRGIAGTITEIWVDDADSLAGGRELWGIPKDMATFDVATGRTTRASASTGQDWIATAAFTARAGPALPLPGRCTIAQPFAAGLKHSTVRVRAHSGLAAASWNINRAGPLGYLAGHKPVLNTQLRDFDMLFGDNT